jgi:hypothetical protein
MILEFSRERLLLAERCIRILNERDEAHQAFHATRTRTMAMPSQYAKRLRANHNDTPASNTHPSDSKIEPRNKYPSVLPVALQNKAAITKKTAAIPMLIGVEILNSSEGLSIN